MSDPTDPPELPDDHGPHEPQGNAQGNGDQAKPYKVGYGKPPVETRFKKGRSGNPYGRPRKRKSEPVNSSNAAFLELLTQEAHRPIALRENGQPIKLSAMQAAMRALWAEAIKGKRLSQKLAFGIEREAEAERRQLESSKYEWLWELKARGRRIIAECNRSGQPVPELYPHPDDIIVDRLTRETHVDGPLSREHDDYYRYIAAARDFCLLYSEYLKRMKIEIVAQYLDRKPTCAFLVLAHMVNSKLPTRYRWAKVRNSGGFGEAMGHQASGREGNLYDDQGFALMWEYSSLPRRELRRRVKEGFAQIEILQSKCSRLLKSDDDKPNRKAGHWQVKLVTKQKPETIETIARIASEEGLREISVTPLGRSSSKLILAV
ncbi:MAG: DUF5681 domain-containing protein [Dongiaceae bacterium]